MNKEKSFKHIVPIQIRFNDIDGQQHVNNAVYQSYFDIGREGYFSAIHGQHYHTGGKSVIIAAVQTDFMRPVFRHDKIQVETKVISIGNKSLKMFQKISSTDDEVIYATCSTVFAGFDYEKQETIIIPSEMRKAIEQYEK
ncbi:MAG: acyl-CoA thioesterase [Spirochaetales bacterium]|nr:acyl-CoA thioesterase [Spirochaetales bacterium]